MSKPQFPDPSSRREVLEPGATAHKAGASEGNRLKALEQGAASRRMSPESLLTTRGDLIRRGASAPERVALGTSGYALMSNGTDALWKPVGTMASGYQENTTSSGSTVLSAGARTASLLSCTVTGDNATPVLLQAFCKRIDSSAASDLQFELWDGTVGSGTLIQASYHRFAANGVVGHFNLLKRVAAFSGSKTFNLAISSTAAATVTYYAGTGTPMVLHATWCPTAS